MSTPAEMTPADGAGVLSWADLRRQYPFVNLGQVLRPLPEHGLIYVKNPKAGSSTLMVWLHRLHTGEVDAEVPQMHKQHGLPTVREIGPRRVARMLSGGAYRFSFVRHPVRRLESVYWAKLVRSRKYRLKAAAELGLTARPDLRITFEQFLGAVEQQDPRTEMDPHWRPQHINLLHPLVRYDHIGHLETFDDDLRRIREEAHLPPVPIEPKNAAPYHRTESVYDGHPDLVRRVERLYAEDFELFGY
jgi:Sulfotransferase family